MEPGHRSHHPGRHVHGAGIWHFGLWKSTNAGVDWINVLTPQISNAFYAAGQITGIAMDPGDHTHLVIESHQGSGCTYDAGADGGGIGTCLAESNDSGATWTLLEIPQPWAENSSVAILGRKTWLWGGFFSGLWQTTNEGTWTAMPGPDAGANSQGGLGVYEAYDSFHHILYSSCFNSGLWAKYVP
jgi:hypothetical protein